MVPRILPTRAISKLWNVFKKNPVFLLFFFSKVQKFIQFSPLLLITPLNFRPILKIVLYLVKFLSILFLFLQLTLRLVLDILFDFIGGFLKEKADIQRNMVIKVIKSNVC